MSLLGLLGFDGDEIVEGLAQRSGAREATTTAAFVQPEQVLWG